MARYMHQRGDLCPRHHYIVTFRKPQTLLNEFLKKTTGNVKNCRLYCIYRTKAQEIAGGCRYGAEREKTMRVVCKKRNLFQRIWKKIIIVILGACAAAGLMACYPEMKHSEIFAVPVQQETKEAIQTRLEELLENNPELQDFVDGYANSDGSVTGGIDEEEKEEDSPLFLQWDERWGYAPYGDSCIGISGCAPTCLSMVIFSLTRDETATPDALADYAMRHNYYVQGKGTQWSFLTDAGSRYSVQGTEISLDENIMKAELDEGHPIIASMRPGDFTTEGHFIVIYGYDEEGFLVHDPNSRLRSEEEWTFKTLYPQIKNLWAYSLE